MRNIALAIIVLAVTIPAMGDVDITIDVIDYNKVVISYDCNEGEVVRAFALDIDVNNGTFIVGSADFAVDPNVADYYIAPSNIGFTIVDGNTVIDDYGTPIAEQDANGGVLEVASLYSENDPDPNRHDPPGSFGNLAVFYLECDPENLGTITLSENSKRGGVVLEDPNAAFTLNLPDPLVICQECLVVDANIGGWVIDDIMLGIWVAKGRPDCWCYPCHRRGDIDGGGVVNFNDAIGTDGVGPPIYDGWIDAIQTQYHPCADINNDGVVNFNDAIGEDGTGGPIYDGWIDGITIQCPPY